MSSDIHSALKQIAWNGICLNVPDAFEIDSLDADHMLIGEDGSPRVEVKWTESPRRFTLETYLKKFISQSQKMLGIRIHEHRPPDAFPSIENHFDFFFFAWESGTAKGDGVLIFCRSCKRLTLIRFFSETRLFNPTKPATGAFALEMLASFSDHSGDPFMPWQVFGMSFLAPAGFRLKDFSFKPGSYRVLLSHGKTQLTAFSWGPAEFLLSRTGLSEFALARVTQIRGLATAGTCSRGRFLEWTYKRTRLKNAERLPVLKHWVWFSIFRICHDTQNNRILGILVESPKKFERTMVQESGLRNV